MNPFRWLFGCPHESRYRARNGAGRLTLVCDTCGDVAVLDLRDDAKAKRLKLRMHGATKKARKYPAEVWHLPRKEQA